MCFLYAHIIHIFGCLFGVQKHPHLIETLTEMYELPVNARTALLMEIQLIRALKKKRFGDKKFFITLLVKYHKYKFGKVMQDVPDKERLRIIRQIVKAERYNEQHTETLVGRRED